MAKSWPFPQGHPKPAFSVKVQTGDQGRFLKNWPKSSPRLKGPKAHLRKWHYPSISMHLNCKDWKRFWGKQRLQKYRMAKVWQSLQGPPKAAFSEKVQTGDQGKFFKNRPKRCPCFKGRKALWRKWHYPLNKMRLKCDDWRRFKRKQRLQKCLNGKLIAILERSTKTRIFLKSANGAPIEIFKKSPRKMPSP